MQRDTLHQVLSDREAKGWEDAAEQKRKLAAAAERYVELIRSGSCEKADVDELLVVAALIGKSASDMKVDLATIEGGAETVRELMSYAGSETAFREIAELLPLISERTKAQIVQLQRQLFMLDKCVDAARERLAKYKSQLSSFQRWKKDHPQFLEGFEAPNGGHLFDAVPPADSVPEFKSWLDNYVELRPAKLETTAASAASPDAA